MRQKTTDAMRAAILDGVLKPGQKLSERELCESLDVSRSCIRESLQHLQAEGLVNIVLHRGPEVASIDAEEVRDIYAVRMSLESLVVSGFVVHASAEQKQAIRACVGRLEQEVTVGGAARLVAIKSDFYDILIEGCGNSVVGQVLRQMNNRVTVLRRASMARPGRSLEAAKELAALVQAIEAGNSVRAVDLCNEHLRNACANALEAMQANIASRGESEDEAVKTDPGSSVTAG